MAASRINAALDGTSMSLVLVTKALVLAGERALPRTTARSAYDLSRAARSALEAHENDLAKSLLAEIRILFEGVSSEYVTTVLRKVRDVERPIEFYARPRVAALAPAKAREAIDAAS